jgi:phage-related minor tail protein
MTDYESDPSSMSSDTLDKLDDASRRSEELTGRLRDLQSGANGFARAMSQAFSSAVVGGKQFDDVLRSLVLRMSDMAVRMAFKPLEQGIASGLQSLLSGFSGASVSTNANGAIKPFAAGGVIGAPTYFPLMNGGVGLAGEAGPEAIVPLARGHDGRLGVASSDGGGSSNVTIQIATPDLESFRRSESYIAGQVARAVARGRRSL